MLCGTRRRFGVTPGVASTTSGTISLRTKECQLCHSPKISSQSRCGSRVILPSVLKNSKRLRSNNRGQERLPSDSAVKGSLWPARRQMNPVRRISPTALRGGTDVSQHGCARRSTRRSGFVDKVVPISPCSLFKPVPTLPSNPRPSACACVHRRERPPREGRSIAVRARSFGFVLVGRRWPLS